jgi:hypothetical protein
MNNLNFSNAVLEELFQRWTEVIKNDFNKRRIESLTISLNPYANYDLIVEPITPCDSQRLNRNIHLKGQKPIPTCFRCGGGRPSIGFCIELLFGAK